MDRIISKEDLPNTLADDTVETIKNSGAGFLADLCKMAALDGAEVDLTGMDARDSGAGFVQDMLKAHDDEDLVPPPEPSVTLTSLAPDTTPIDTVSPFNVTVNGTGFTAGCVVVWDGADIVTNFISDVQIIGTGLNAVGETVRTLQVAVRDEAGLLSNELTFGFIATPPLKG